MNFSEADKEKILGRLDTTDDDFIVLESNWPALEVFINCQTQWRTSLQGLTGLDYSAVISVINLLHKKKQRKKLFNQVRLIERGALAQLDKAASKDNG